uniref:Uncharacterized protein n=1 Tax=Arundo donax TaxID=35708 RepID=A0A0A9AP91_ARUDO
MSAKPQFDKEYNLGCDKLNRGMHSLNSSKIHKDPR